MNSSCLECIQDCFHNHCHCNFISNEMKHITLSCCDSKHHLVCILNKTSCPKCNTNFSNITLQYVHNISQEIKGQKQMQKKKQKIFRKQIKTTVRNLISFRENLDLNKRKQKPQKQNKNNK